MFIFKRLFFFKTYIKRHLKLSITINNLILLSDVEYNIFVHKV